MKICQAKAVFARAVLALAFVLPARAQTRCNAVPNGSSVKLDGTSTSHEWEMEGKIIGGYMELGAGVKLDPAQTDIAGLKDNKLPAKVHAFIPISSIHSKADHLPGVMDDLMQSALKAEAFPRIDYTLKEMTLKTPHVAGQPFTFDASGDLAIAGVTNAVTFPVAIERVDAKKIRVAATVPLKMTSFKVDPPAPNIGLGLMRCGDGVTITIDWTLTEK